ncbi:MAG: hypothetical protein A2005_00820 [Desulfuromonadales bacterium GWC2_61_20]|nr:MAG: hypothetical protein A2005_00820 [Desulfuromonadales bacterium GWC2_61_20]
MKRLGMIVLLLPLLLLRAVPVSAVEPVATAGAVATGLLPPGESKDFFPEGDIFAAPLASIKEPRFHVTWLKFNLDSGEVNVGSVSFGENFGLVRWQGWRDDQYWQLGISGAIQAQFNLDSPSKDLVNADYIIGFPLTVRSKNWSGRLRLYHQSSHLGDEYLLYQQSGVPAMERINLSYEAVEAWLGYDWRQWRIFAGPSLILHSDTPLQRKSVQAGFDYRGGERTRVALRPFAALFVNWWEEVDWVPSASLRTGVILASPYAGRRQCLVYAEGFKGYLPFGQFYRENAFYYGLGVSFGF